MFIICLYDTDTNKYGYVYHTPVRHSVAVLLLPWFYREQMTGIPFIHCHFIPLLHLLHWLVCGSTSLGTLVTL